MSDATILITDSEAAELLKLSPRQVTRLARRGELPAVYLPNKELRFDPADLRRWVETCKRPTPNSSAAEGGAK